ncbi:MAG: SAM-dependent methyltransferase [Aureispira sp.]
MAGTLYLIPTPLTEGVLTPLPEETLAIVRRLKVFVVERGKTARQFIKQTETPIPFAEMTFFELNKRTNASELPSFLKPALDENQDIGILSEAGCPGIADPGADLVNLAHQRGLNVVPLVGPSSILLALMASGLNGQQFAFHGYLPIKNPNRKKALQDLERQSKKQRQTQIFIETPYRNDGLISDMLSALNGQTKLCVAADLTAPDAYIKTKTILNWKRQAPPRLHKRPAIFLILAS